MIAPSFLDPAARPAAAVILAGGRARRLGGGDKGATLIDGRSVLSRLTESLAPQVGALALNANGDAGRFAALGLPVLADPAGAEGPLAGILAGLDWAAAQGRSWLLTVPTDTPFLPGDLVLRLAHGLSQGGAAIAASGGREHPVIGLWPVALGEPLRRFLVAEGRRKAGEWARLCGAVAVEWPDTPVDPFLNLNAPADVELARRFGRQVGPRTGAVVVPAKDSARDLLADFAAWARQRGLVLGGVIQRGHHGAVMVDLESGAVLPIMQDLGRDGGCAVDTQAVVSAAMLVRGAVERRRDLVIVNKFGPLEAEGLGLADEMLAAMAEDVPLLTSVTVDRLDAWLHLCGGHCQLLPADPAALRCWSEALSPGS